ncbi:Ig-like domain repeat protein [Methanobrevibacter sp.]
MTDCYELGVDDEHISVNDNNLPDTYSSSEEDKNQTELSSTSSSIYYQGNYQVALKDSDSNRYLSNKTVNFVIDDVHYTSNTDDNGIASINLNLRPGNYNVFAFFNGDDDFNSCNMTSAISILSTIKSNDLSKYYKGTTPFTATFYTSQGKALTNTIVNINVNGKSYTPRTNANGVVSIPINLKPGSYRIVSTDPVTGFKITTTFTVLSTIIPGKLKKVEGERFYVKFLKSNGKALSKKVIKIKIKGKTHKIKTNSKGQVSISLKKFKKGTYKVVFYNKDGLSKTVKVKVYKRKASTKLTAGSYTFLPNNHRLVKAKLSTTLADSSNSDKTIKLKINGKTYSQKTDSNGVAVFDLSSVKKGIYSVQFTYDGNKYFKASKCIRTVKIYDTTQTKINLKSTSHFGYGAGTLLKVAYTAGGVPLTGKTVHLKIDGETHRLTTDAKGIASVPINLQIGEYSVGYDTDDSSGFTGTSGSFDIDVFKRSESKITWKCGNKYKDNKQVFTVLVTGLDGKYASGGSIDLVIDGETHTVTVGSKGIAKFKTEVPIGKYKVSVKFRGNNEYLSSSSSKTVDVELSKFKNGLNEKGAHALKAYLKSSSHCKVGTKALKKLVKSLTKGKTTKVDKAKAIYNYVRDTLDYSYYYDTKYGSSKTLKLKRGNCVDHSHLLVAMFRTAGFHARYVHGYCHFSDGDSTGHVWTQVKIGNKWVCADAVSLRNSLGKVKNWNTKNYRVNGKYASLPF